MDFRSSFKIEKSYSLWYVYERPWWGFSYEEVSPGKEFSLEELADRDDFKPYYFFTPEEAEQFAREYASRKDRYFWLVDESLKQKYQEPMVKHLGKLP